MSIEHVVNNSELTNQIKDYITNLIEINANNFHQQPCVVKIHSGKQNQFRISDNSHYVNVKNHTLIVNKLKALNKNVNWNTMPGTLLLLKKWKFISNYDDAQDALKFDVIVEDVDVLDKGEPHSGTVNITNLYEDLELRNKFQRLKKYYQAKKFEEQHPIDNALHLIEVERPLSQLADMGYPEEYTSTALNKFPSTFSAGIFNETGNLRMPKKHYQSKYDGDALNLKAAERLVGLDREDQKDSVHKKKSGSKSEVLGRSKGSTPFKGSVFKHSPIVIEHISEKKFWDVMGTGPISTLNKRTPQQDDLEEVYNDEDIEKDKEKEVEDDYLESFKLIKIAKALEKKRSPAKSNKVSIQKTREPRTLLNKRKAQYEDDFEEDVYKDLYGGEDEEKGYFKTFKLLKGERGIGKTRSLKASPFRGRDDFADLTVSDVIYRRSPGKKSDGYKGGKYRQVEKKEVVNPLNQGSKINLNEYKTVNWKMSKSSAY